MLAIIRKRRFLNIARLGAINNTPEFETQVLQVASRYWMLSQFINHGLEIRKGADACQWR
jgi:hypothetical protein